MCPGGRPSSLLRRARESRPAEMDPTTHVARQSGVPAGDAACLPLRTSARLELTLPPTTDRPQMAMAPSTMRGPGCRHPEQSEIRV